MYNPEEILLHQGRHVHAAIEIRESAAPEG